MRAGRELEAAVAEKLMGALWWRSSATGHRALFIENPPSWFTAPADGSEKLVGDWQTYRGFPRYSTDIAAAWEIVETMRARGLLLSLSDNRTCWRAAFDDPHAEEAEGEECEASTAPHAICLAALAASNTARLAADYTAGGGPTNER